MQVFFLRLRGLFAPHIRVPRPLQQSLQRLNVPLRPPEDTEHSESLGSSSTEQASDVINNSNKPQDPHLQPKRPGIVHAGELLALDPVRGEWAFDARQRRVWPRVAANVRMLAFSALLATAAALNLIQMPRLLEGTALVHPRAALAEALAMETSLAAGMLHVLVPEQVCICMLCLQHHVTTHALIEP